MRCFLRNLSFTPSSPSPPLVPVHLPSKMETHFWYIVPDEVKSVSLLNQYMELLSPCERENVLRMSGDELQKRALLARTLDSEIIVVPPDHPEALKSKWRFALLEVAGSHYAAICTAANGMAEVGIKLSAWKTIPFVQDECVSGTDVIVPIQGLIKQL